MRDRYDVITLMGPPGSGKSFLGKRLRESGVASYQELEPLLRDKFGSGEAFQARIREAGTYVWESYREQLRESELTVTIESAGVLDRPILENMQRHYRVAFVHVRTDRSVCIDRVAGRAADANGATAAIERFLRGSE